jgi:5'-3' exonuclease
VGDDADGIPGLPGFGERTASQLLSHFVQLEGVPFDASRWPDGIRGADRLAATLRDHLPEALLYRKLATLVRDVPLPQTALEDLRHRGVPLDRLAAFSSATGANLRAPSQAEMTILPS